MSGEQVTTRYLTLAGVAKRIGVSPNTSKKYADDGRLPPPDAITGDGPKSIRGWLPETIDTWQANRPGRGHRRKTSKQPPPPTNQAGDT